MNKEQSDLLFAAFTGLVARSVRPLEKRIAALEEQERQRDDSSDMATQLAELFRRALDEAITNR